MKIKRSEKGTRIARYITGHAGISDVRYSMDHGRVLIDLPAPYGTEVTTDRVSDRFFKSIRDNADNGLSFTIRYDGTIDGVDNAYVGMTLRTFTQLLKAHYEKEGN